MQETRTGTMLAYELLNVCEFTSTRKRMSCIFRDHRGKLILMCKGVDTVIEERLSDQSRQGSVLESTQDFVYRCAKEGLRTLYLAERELDETEYEQWSRESE